MRSLLKVILLLFCVQRGAGHWIRSLLDQRREAASPTSSPDGDETRGRAPEDDARRESFGVGQSSPRPGGPTPTLGPVRSRRSSEAEAEAEAPCGLRSILLRVRDLGLGYDSDESVLFKYCGGVCPRAPRSNHDLTLANLLLAGVLPRPPAPQEGVLPCCRPTHHEDMAFLDNSHRWHKVEKLSAAGCSCVG